MIKEIRQYPFRGFNIHVVEIDGVSNTEVTPPEPFEGSFLISGSQEEQFLPGLKFY